MNIEVAKIKKLGKNIAKYRKMLNLTQNELAEKANTSREYISRVEIGISCPSLNYIFKIAEALEVKEEELFKF